MAVVMLHGFTGDPSSMSGWAHELAEPAPGWPGARVLVPRLPGHGTNWRDLARTRWWDWYAAAEDAYHQVAVGGRPVFTAGLSMGGALALQLAADHEVAGVLLVNPAIATRDRRITIAAPLHRFLPSQPGIASDIALAGVEESGYDRFSVTSLKTMTDLWRGVQRSLSRVTAPVLLLRSRTDHVVDSLSGELIVSGIRDVVEVPLTRSFHVATLDHDAGIIADQSRAFIAAHS